MRLMLCKELDEINEMGMTRVLEVIYGFGYGGIRAFIMNYLRYLDKEKFKVDIYVFGYASSPFTQQVKDMGADIYFEPENYAARKPWLFVRLLETFMKEHGPYDVVHANTNLISAWVLLAAARMNVPIRLPHSHNASHFGRSWMQDAYSYLRRFMIDKLATKKLACGRLAGESMYGHGSDFEVVANGISLERFMKRDERRIAELRENFDIPDGVKVYANVTRLDPPKNHLFAVDVFREIHELEPDAVFLYGGVTPKISPTIDLVQERIRDYGLEKHCRYTGPIMDVEQLYHMTDLWIYCSVFEGLPFGPIELQAASVPVIASDVITDEIDLGLGLVHFLSLSDSPKKWAKLAVSINKKQLPEEVIVSAFHEHNFDIRQNVEKLEAIYEGRL